jgi:hypothetical protein
MRTRRKHRKLRRKPIRKQSKKQRGAGQEPKIFHFFNIFHYGDNILNLKFFYINAKILKEKGIQIHYYYDNNYIKDVKELERYVDPAIVHLHTLSEKPDYAIQLWMGNPIGDLKYNEDFVKYYNAFYTQILGYIGLKDLNIDTSLYQPEEYLKEIYAKLDTKYHDLDVLIINAEPQSNQQYDKTKMDDLCIKLSKKYKVATTTHVNNDILCTFNDGLKLQDIGAVSTHAKNIISVFSGPITPCFNSETKNTVKKWFVISGSGSGLKNNFINVTADNLEQILEQIVV